MINTLQSQDLVNSFKNENNSSITPLSRAIYTSETVAIKYKPLSGYAGSQLPGGNKFSTGGGFWWTDSTTSPTVSGSVSFSVPYKPVDISVSLGLSSTTDSRGLFVSVPNTYDFFKLYVIKTNEIKQVNIYRQQYASSPKELYQIMYPSTLYRQEQFASKVQ